MIESDKQGYRPRSIMGRIRLAQGRYIGKLMHIFTHVPPEREPLMEALAEVQGALNEYVLGKERWIPTDLAKQTKPNGGVGHVCAEGQLDAVWARRIKEVLEPGEQPWKNFVAYYLQKAYGGELAKGKELLTTNMSFNLVHNMPSPEITEHARRCFRATTAEIPGV